MATRSLEEVCRPSARTFTFFPDRLPLREALRLCEVVGGRLSVPQSEEENALLYRLSEARAEECSGGVGASYLWLGANDAGEERRWAYWGSGEPLPWEGPWRGSGPNGGTVENCLVMLGGAFSGRWSDIACLDSYSFCLACESDGRGALHLKGAALCDGSPFDRSYYLSGEEEGGGRPSLAGFFHSDIYWNSSEGAWVLRSLKEEGAVALWRPPRRGLYPLGTNAWTLGAAACGAAAGASVRLTLSRCGPGEFTCGDGGCVGLARRCDLRLDCGDGSDEARCSLVAAPRGYRAAVPPPPLERGRPLGVLFGVDVLSFPSVATEDLTFAASLRVSLRWRDTRLDFLDLKADRTLNLLSGEAAAALWTPSVFFGNAQGNVFTNLDRGSRVECIREGGSTAGGPHLPQEVNIFSGFNNSLETSQIYTVTYTCDFDLLMFPFDAQSCTMQFVLVSASSSYMTLVPKVANYSGQVDLIEYSIGQVSIRSLPKQEFSSVAVEVQFTRRYGFYLLTLYIPTTLLICIAYSTFYFNPDDFNSRIIVALTSLLVLASLFTQTSNSLPKTSYFKLIDVWLFFSIVMIFIVVLLQTLIDFSQQCIFDDNSRVVKIMKKIYSICGRSTTGSQKPADNFYPTSVEKDKSITKINSINVEPNGAEAAGTHARSWVCRECDERPRQPTLFGRARRRPNWKENKDVNMSLMTKSRILIPIIFLIFNGCYWGVTFVHVSKVNGGAN